MYYEEKVINNILCFRNTPTGEFKQLSQEQLTVLLLDMRNTFENHLQSISLPLKINDE